MNTVLAPDVRLSRSAPASARRQPAAAPKPPLAADDPRYERKFVTQQCMASVVDLLRGHPAMFREVYTARWVNSVYLDSVRRACFHDNEEGLSARVKVRVRWYGDLFGHVDRPVLELKRKANSTGYKDRLELAPLTVDDDFSAAALRRCFADSGAVTALSLLAVERLEPSLLNRYRRRYFLSADGRFRVTTDGDLQFYRVRAAWNSFTLPARLPGTTVVELKYAVEDDGRAREICRDLPFRAERNSKYVIGLRLVGL